MVKFFLSIVVVLALAVSAEATPGFFRRTPARPFVGPRFVPVNRNFVSPGVRGFNGYGGARTIVVDQFGNVIAVQ